MRPLSHINIAHSIWKQVICPGDTAVDATAGNGLDSYALAAMGAKVIAFEIQNEALLHTKERLQDFSDVTLYEMCHSRMGEVISPKSVKLIAFNLGYLPGGDKTCTTLLTNTVAAIKASLDLVVQGGLISITCYPGHAEGAVEEAAILAFCQKLNPKEWCISSYKIINRDKCPHLISLIRLLE